MAAFIRPICRLAASRKGLPTDGHHLALLSVPYASLCRINSQPTTTSTALLLVSKCMQSDSQGQEEPQSASSVCLRWLSTAPNGATGSSSGRQAKEVVRAPALGESTTDGTVFKWLHGVGSVVTPEEVLCVLETGTKSVNVSTKVAGKIVSIAAGAGSRVVVGSELAVIEPLSSSALATEEIAATTAAATPQADTGAVMPHGAAALVAAGEGFSRRTPSILFRSVRNRLERLGLIPHQQQQQPQQQQQQQQASKPECSSNSSQQQQKIASPDSGRAAPQPTVIRYSGIHDLPPFLLRPALSAEEMETVNGGGPANIDDAVRSWTMSLAYHPQPPAMKWPHGNKGSKRPEGPFKRASA
ncbi:dihydrolipoamide acyltransferase, putative [Eimeria necatrix]|uniref:Dihydrolipoamide acyltransferase, putative n=1 Tax=Eimeria necatrix TaxID=51315 RepID=U6MVA8_9EIME|nr:dihydrolipoamide acyltransferase, putative [Eimeria necatrix]CDJ66404.1 dihydrolipoamide acyltransferase, putative [Eimeria necatrix]